MTTPYIEQPPPPAALLFAIRSIGYSFEMAVADIIDNSISAHAKIAGILKHMILYCRCVVGLGIGLSTKTSASYIYHKLMWIILVQLLMQLTI